MTKREKENESEKLRLEKKQARLKDRLNSLKTELQSENIDYEPFLENFTVVNEEDETSTSTASGKSKLTTIHRAILVIGNLNATMFIYFKKPKLITTTNLTI
jgi:hypothetical protein